MIINSIIKGVGVVEEKSLFEAIRDYPSGTSTSQVYDGMFPLIDNLLEKIEFQEYEGNTTFSTNTNLGRNADIDQYITFARFNGDLTINSGVTVTTYLRRKMLVLYVKGNLEISGTLTMTARGAVSARIGRSLKIITGVDHTDDDPGTGNGGGNGNYYGRGWKQYSRGNIYSGGCGGGGTNREASNYLPEGSGRGGNASTYDSLQSCGGGAGNPGGSGAGKYAKSGQSGTGGVIVLFVDGDITVNSTGIISCNGMNGGSGYNPYGAPGGGSGGGRIFIYHSGEYVNNGSVVCIGGSGGSNSTYTSFGDNGGDGTITQAQNDLK